MLEDNTIGKKALQLKELFHELKKIQKENIFILENFSMQVSEIVNLVEEFSTINRKKQYRLLQKYDFNQSELRKIFQFFVEKKEKLVAYAYLHGELDIKDHYYQYGDLAKSLIGKKGIVHKILGKFNKKKCLFVGSGACPMTAIHLCFFDKKIYIDLLDMSGEASRLASQLLNTLGLASRMTILPAVRVENFNRFDEYDLITFAIMVGKTEHSKKAIYTSIHDNLSKGKIIFTRDIEANTFKGLLHAPFPLEELSSLYKQLKSFSTNSIVSNLVLKKI